MLSLETYCWESVIETGWPSRDQVMVGGGLPPATHFSDRNGPEKTVEKLPGNTEICSEWKKVKKIV